MVQSGIEGGLFYEVHEGPDDAPVVILSPGLDGSGAFWAPQMKALTRRFTVVLYDHRGTGRSERTIPHPYFVQDMGDDIVQLMDALGLQTAHVAGLAGLSMALNHPDRIDRLCVVNGWTRPDPHMARCFKARVSLLQDIGAEAYVSAEPIFLYPANWISENTARIRSEEPRMVAAFPTAEVTLTRIQALLAFDIDARLPDIKAPVLVSASADDMLVPVLCSRRLAERLPNAALDVAPWERFNRVLSAFLAGEPPP